MLLICNNLIVFLTGKKAHWSVIASLLANKTDVQCYERWHRVVEPRWRRRRGNPGYIMRILDNEDPSIIE